MLVLSATNLKKHFGTRTILDVPTLHIYEGDKIGIIGDNGAGKTTLLHILHGTLAPDEGTVTRHMTPLLLSQLEDADASATRSCGERQKTRIQEALSRRNCIVFADEPTANLDESGIRWVTRQLQGTSTVLLISHDRALLDAVCTRILALENGQLTSYTGNYTDYEAAVAHARAQQTQAHKQYEAQRAQLGAAIQTKQKKVAHQRQQKRRDYANNLSEARLGGYKRGASMQQQERQAKVLARRLERLEHVDAVKEPAVMRLNFALTNPPRTPYAMRCDGLTVAFDGKPVLQDAKFQIRMGETVALCGANGSGKSTLLKRIAAHDASIRLAPKLEIGYLEQDCSHIDATKTVLENAMAQSVQSAGDVRGALAALLFQGDAVHKQASVLSGGERMRLALGMLMVSGVNCLLLDEPNNFLDIASLEAVTRAIRAYPGTILLVSHDERLVADVADRQLFLQDGTILERAPHTKAAAPDANALLLDIRLSALLSQISVTSSETERAVLDAQYQALLAEKHRLLQK